MSPRFGMRSGESPNRAEHLRSELQDGACVVQAVVPANDPVRRLDIGEGQIRPCGRALLLRRERDGQQKSEQANTLAGDSVTWSFLPERSPFALSALHFHLDDPGGSRTRDLRIKSPLLYQLSYRVCFQHPSRHPVRELSRK